MSHRSNSSHVSGRARVPSSIPSFRRAVLAAAGVALLALSSVHRAAAAAPAGLEGWYPGQPYALLYSPDHVTRVAGRVLGVDRFVPREGMAEGVRVRVATGTDTVWVHLGPAAYVDAQRVRLAAGDAVRVTGSAAHDGDQAVVLATRVDRDGRTLRLREQDGTPAWLDFRPR